MSQSAYATSLRTLGGPYQTRGSASDGGSGSVANQEQEGESTINPVQENVQERAEPVVIPEDPDSPSRRASKRKKSLRKKKVAPENVVVDDEIEEVEGVDVDIGSSERPAGPRCVGNYTVAQVANVMSGMPSKTYWAEMHKSGLNAAFQKCVEHWGQVCFFYLVNFLHWLVMFVF